MSEVRRFGVSIDSQLLDSFDYLIEQKRYMNRSEAIRDLIRASLVETRAENENEEMVGTITLVYNHHVHDLAEKLNEQQHANNDKIISSLHVHLDAHNCLEVLVLKGSAETIKSLGQKLISTKGVKHGHLVLTTTGQEID